MSAGSSWGWTGSPEPLGGLLLFLGPGPGSKAPVTGVSGKAANGLCRACGLWVPPTRAESDVATVLWEAQGPSQLRPESGLGQLAQEANPHIHVCACNVFLHTHIPCVPALACVHTCRRECHMWMQSGRTDGTVWVTPVLEFSLEEASPVGVLEGTGSRAGKPCRAPVAESGAGSS